MSRWISGVEESQKTDVHYRYGLIASNVVLKSFFEGVLEPWTIHVGTRLLSSSVSGLDSAEPLQR